MFSRKIDERNDTLLDRMEHIVEEEGEDNEESVEGDDDESMDAGELFSHDAVDEDDESEEEDDFGQEDEYLGNSSSQIEYGWPRNTEEGSETTSLNSDPHCSSGISLEEGIIESSSAFDVASSDEASSFGRRPSYTHSRRRSGRFAIGVDSNASLGTSVSPIPTGPKRRSSVSLKNAINGKWENDEGNSSVTSLSSGGGRLTRTKSARRISVRRTSINSASVAVSNDSSSLGHSMDAAASRLGQGGNREWENVAAAAAVVQLSDGGKRSHAQFAVNDHVLVFLSILNHMCSVKNEDAYTVNPVNKFGYPCGEGKTHEEQQGPHSYVLAVVKKIHFDEDVRYYTVARLDCGVEQRAYTAWMEPITSPIAVESATRAALQTGSSEAKNEDSEKEDKVSIFHRLSVVLAWPVHFANETAIPLFRLARAKAKTEIALILFGSNPYSCKIRATGINLLVLCSFIYLFLDVITLAFFPPEADPYVAVIGCIVWSILSLELFLEWIIRPKDYFEQILSEKSFSPPTARNINSFHLIFESISLFLYVPEFFAFCSGATDHPIPFSLMWGSIRAVLGPTKWLSAAGRFCVGLRTLRMFGLIRHWKKMWINCAFEDENTKRNRITNLFIREDEFGMPRFSRLKFKNKIKEEAHGEEFPDQVKKVERNTTDEDQRLKKAATIGTSLMVVNSHRALFILLSIVVVLPMIQSINQVNNAAIGMTDLLQVNNVNNPNTSDCTAINLAVNSWLLGISAIHYPTVLKRNSTFVLYAQISPPRCSFENDSGVITKCVNSSYLLPCETWDKIDPPKQGPSVQYLAEELNLRVRGIREESREEKGNTTFSVKVFYNQNQTVAFMNIASFLELLSCLILVWYGLTVLRNDAGRLVLHPLQRMLKIVVRYARNPLSPSVVSKTRYKHKRSKDGDNGEDNSGSDAERDGDKELLGNYETEQLISAISKIADLLRKCWGVAGAGIISTNLARTQDGKTVVFNPTVPGKRVYALFGFVTINGFSDQLRALDRDVMILINDVAKVVHDEIYRWALGNTGECNKNLGSSFLLVFRIGDFDEVLERQARATDVVFQTEKRTTKKRNNLRQRKKSGIRHGRGTLTRNRTKRKGDIPLQLASLPGIQSFSDRALLGMLKSFAGIHRDPSLIKWKSDFRLGAGVGAYTVNIIIGMDAGWAVEGAVGSEYKIDATYLSPHVNMAARMMSATKQYGVTILLSQAVEELLSRQARSKLRHLDTVKVKGSSVSQRIFTYDARHKGVDFFLFERSPEQADLDADSYSPVIWDNDQDLRAMRQHVSDEFTKKFKEGKDLYLDGEWKKAIEVLKDADDIMITTVLEEGYMDYNPDEIDTRIFDRNNKTEEIARIRNEHGDGACKCLIAYMEKRNGVPPANWEGVKPLTSK